MFGGVGRVSFLYVKFADRSFPFVPTAAEGKVIEYLYFSEKLISVCLILSSFRFIFLLFCLNEQKDMSATKLIS